MVEHATNDSRDRGRAEGRREKQRSGRQRCALYLRSLAAVQEGLEAILLAFDPSVRRIDHGRRARGSSPPTASLAFLIFPYLWTLPNKVVAPASLIFLVMYKGLCGGRTRTRTWDPLIKSQLLYQLSYAPGARRRDRWAGCCSKAIRNCPAKAGKTNAIALPAAGTPSRGSRRDPVRTRDQRRKTPRPSGRPPARAHTNGKPPGGDPAAPVRRRSCRGAGSATAGARPCIW